MMLADMDFHTK